jgi:TPP-dependent pyruvate/acetoin dehydrogenase alpha subunit
MKTLTLDDEEMKEKEEKEKAEKDDPVKISHKHIKKVIIIYL